MLTWSKMAVLKTGAEGKNNNNKKENKKKTKQREQNNNKQHKQTNKKTEDRKRCQRNENLSACAYVWWASLKQNTRKVKHWMKPFIWECYFTSVPNCKQIWLYDLCNYHCSFSDSTYRAGRLRNMNTTPFACIHCLAGERSMRIHCCEPFCQESWTEDDVYLFKGGQGKVSSEHFHSRGKNRSKSVVSKVIILYINHSAWNNMLSIFHSFNAHRDGKKSFIMW